jgi:hypothetical protein
MTRRSFGEDSPATAATPPRIAIRAFLLVRETLGKG